MTHTSKFEIIKLLGDKIMEKAKNILIFTLLMGSIITVYFGMLYTLNSVVPEVQKNVEQMILRDAGVQQ